MRCFHCKRELQATDRFCPYCGEDQGFDRSLIDAARAGDQDAVADLYSRTYENVYHSVRALIRDEDTVLDLVQDTFVKAFANLDKLQDPNKFRAWVKRIGHNLAVDYTRRAKPLLFSQMTEEESERVLNFEDPQPANSPELQLDRKETGRLVSEILGCLSDDQRLVVGMYYYEQRSVREIAQELGVSENTVKSRLFQGRGKIEKQVRALEAQGTRLYSLSPTAFLLALLRRAESFPVSIPADRILDSVIGQMLRQSASRAVGSAGDLARDTVRGSAQQAARSAGRGAAARVGQGALGSAARGTGAAAGKAAAGAARAAGLGLAKGAAVKVAALITAATVTLGGGAYVVHELSREPAAPVQTLQPADSLPAATDAPAEGPLQEIPLPWQEQAPVQPGESPLPTEEPAPLFPTQEPEGEPLTLDRYETLRRGRMSVEYPIFRGRDCERVNSRVYEEAEAISRLGSDQFEDQELIGEYRCAVTLLNDRILSMVFWGSTYVPSAIRDNDYLRTLNLDLQDLQSFELAQIYRIDDPDFEDTVYTYGLFPGQPETCYPQDLYPDALAYDRNNSRAMQYVYHGVGYLKPEGAVFSGPADHFTGSDHIEILVPYERLLDFYIGPFSPEELSAHLPETSGLDEKLRQAYLEQLASREEDIRYFAGKNGQQELACVAIRDLNGDGVPELLYVTSQEGAGGAFLWIYRYENGQALKCAQLTWEPEAGTEILRCLFQREGDPAFYALYDGWSEEHSINRILRLSLDSAGNLQSSVLSRVETFGGRYPAEFFFEGRACTDEEHWALAEEFYDSASLVLLYDLRDGVDGRSQSGLIDGTLETCPSCSMRYDRAVAWLRGS